MALRFAVAVRNVKLLCGRYAAPTAKLTTARVFWTVPLAWRVKTSESHIWELAVSEFFVIYNFSVNLLVEVGGVSVRDSDFF